MSESLFAATGNAPGMLVTIDGPNGSGKTHLTRAVAVMLRERGAAVHSTQQPSESPIGVLARRCEAEVRGRALACLVAADRHNQFADEIGDHLEAGEIVLCDRYIESSLVLQRLDGVEPAYIVAINAGIARPDLRIQLRAEPEVIRRRLASRISDPARRFERSAGPERELEFYEEADRLLGVECGLAAEVYDTSETNTEELGREVAALIEERRGRGGG